MARSRIALAVVFVCAALLVFGVADFAVNANKAYPGVRVGQIDAAGKTADELAALIDEVYGCLLYTSIVSGFLAFEWRRLRAAEAGEGSNGLHRA